MKKFTIILMTILLTFSFNAWAQTTIWSEDFSGYSDFSGYIGPGNITTGDYPASVTKWSLDVSNANLTASSDWFLVHNVSGNLFETRDSDGECIWTSESITISSYTNVGIEVSVSESGTHESSDYVKLYYKLDGGSETLFETNGNNVDDFGSVTASQTGLSGSSLQIVIKTYNNAGTEYLRFDDIIVTETSTPAIIVSPSSLSGISYIIGNGPSSEQSFTIQGTNLTDDISIAATTNYEISTGTGGSFVATNPITLTQSGGVVSSTTIYTRLKAGLSAADYNNEDITATSTDATDKTVTCSGTVEAPATTSLPYYETFDSDLGDCYTYSVLGDTKGWYWYNSFALVNGYNSGDVEEDWLILPGIDFDSYSNEIMTFDTWKRYGSDDANNYLKLVYSTNYSGLGDPSSATWTEIPFDQPTSDQTWEFSGIADLSSINGTSVYFAFKYHYEPGSYRLWEVDNILIREYVPVVPIGSIGIIIALLLITTVLVIRRGKLI